MYFLTGLITHHKIIFLFKMTNEKLMFLYFSVYVFDIMVFKNLRTFEKKQLPEKGK